MVKEARTLEKIDFKLKKAILDLEFFCRKNSAFLKFVQFKDSNKQLRASKAYLSCQNIYVTRKLIPNRNYKMSYIDYVHVCNTFLVSNNKNISKVKETQNKESSNLKNMGKALIKLHLIFPSYNYDHKKSVL